MKFIFNNNDEEMLKEIADALMESDNVDEQKEELISEEEFFKGFLEHLKEDMGLDQEDEVENESDIKEIASMIYELFTGDDLEAQDAFFVANLSDEEKEEIEKNFEDMETCNNCVYDEICDYTEDCLNDRGLSIFEALALMLTPELIKDNDIICEGTGEFLEDIIKVDYEKIEIPIRNINDVFYLKDRKKDLKNIDISVVLSNPEKYRNKSFLLVDENNKEKKYSFQEIIDFPISSIISKKLFLL